MHTFEVTRRGRRTAAEHLVESGCLRGASRDQHTFDLFHSLRLETVIDAIEAFTAWVRSR